MRSPWRKHLKELACVANDGVGTNEKESAVLIGAGRSWSRIAIAVCSVETFIHERRQLGWNKQNIVELPSHESVALIKQASQESLRIRVACPMWDAILIRPF
jgi:hypothetical protein